ncbi:MAG TPA: alpha/beta hydrolase [Steroidobacteraceae bacterium]
MAKLSKISSTPAETVRMRRAYFDFRFGQLHVRTAFPATGGFDEQVTLICLHPAQGSSRIFKRLLPGIADVRSVYAPDLPGCAESDPAPTSGAADAAGAISDLADDLRLRQIDLFGVQGGANVALALAAARPELVRRLVILGTPAADPLSIVKQSALVILTPRDAAQSPGRLKAALPNARHADMADDVEKLLDAEHKALAMQIGAFLSSRF